MKLWIFGANFSGGGVTMKVKRRPRIRWFSLFFLLVLPVAAYGGVPEVSHVMVTDVTTTSFSVIWAANEPSTAGLEVYTDENGSSLITDAVITPHPIESGDDTIKTAAEDNGVMKVRVTGLAPDTTYYFMTITTSKSTPDTTYNPSADPFTPVTTESETVRTYESGGDILPFSNDLIIEACYLDDGTTPAEGTLLLATVAGGNHPITAFVGDGVASPNAVIDLNNVFSSDTSENLDLSQGLNLTLLNFRGLAGNSIVTHEVPLDESLSEAKPPDFAMKAGWNMVSFQLEPGDTNIGTVLEPLWDEVDAVWAYDASIGQWLSIDKSVPEFLWDLTDCHSVTGYWFVMNDGASLIVNGSFSSNTIQLYEGWNLVGSKSIETVDLMDAIAPIYDKLEAVWTYDTTENRWLSIDKSVPQFLWDLFIMAPGKAYWFVMNENCNDEECQW
jgi:hypothetical protein